MTRTERDEVKASLLAYMDEFLQKTQDSDAPFDCYIPDEAAALMRDAAFSVIEAVENTQSWLKREGHINNV